MIAMKSTFVLLLYQSSGGAESIATIPYQRQWARNYAKESDLEIVESYACSISDTEDCKNLATAISEKVFASDSELVVVPNLHLFNQSGLASQLIPCLNSGNIKIVGG